MKISWRLIVFGLATFAVFLLATVPAEYALPRLNSRGIVAAGASGSIWNGRAAVLQIGNTQLGAVTWNIRFLPLLIGKLGADIGLKRDDGSVSAKVRVGFGKRIQIHDLQGTLPISSMDGIGLPGGWQGNLRIHFSTLELENKWPVQAIGSIDAVDLIGPASQPTALGSFRVDFTNGTKKGSPAPADGLTGSLVSIGEGPLDVAGTLKLMPNRIYTIDAKVATRPTAPASITKALQYLGPPDGEGRRPLSMTGNL